MVRPGDLCFVLHSSFVIWASSVFFAPHFPLLVSLTSPAGTRRPEPAPNPSSALPSPPFRLQPLRFVRAREADIAREISPKTRPHLPWSSAIAQSEHRMRHKGGTLPLPGPSPSNPWPYLAFRLRLPSRFRSRARPANFRHKVAPHFSRRRATTHNRPDNEARNAQTWVRPGPALPPAFRARATRSVRHRPKPPASVRPQHARA